LSFTAKTYRREMSAPTFVILIVCFASIALADDFKTIDGKEYKNVTVSRVEPDGIVVMSKNGISKIYFAELPQELQTKYGYDPGSAADFQRQKYEAGQQRAKEIAEIQGKNAAVRAKQFSAAQDDRQLREANREADKLLIYALIKPHSFGRGSTHVRIQECFKTKVGHHNEGLNVVQDYDCKPNDYLKPFHAVIDEPLPQSMEQGDVVTVALYRIGHSEDSARLPRFTFSKQKAVQFILTGSPQ
jgi:hypothetical protein